MAEIQSERFERQKMNGNGIARESIDGKQVEILCRLAFQCQARVTQLEGNVRLRVPQKSEVLLCNSHDQGIDFVEREFISFVAIRRDRAGTEANHTDAPWVARSQGRERFANS